MQVCLDMDEVIWDANLYRYDLYITIYWWRVVR